MEMLCIKMYPLCISVQYILYLWEYNNWRNIWEYDIDTGITWYNYGVYMTIEAWCSEQKIDMYMNMLFGRSN